LTDLFNQKMFGLISLCAIQLNLLNRTFLNAFVLGLHESFPQALTEAGILSPQNALQGTE